MLLELSDIADVVGGIVREATAQLVARCEALETDNIALRVKIVELAARDFPDGYIERISEQISEVETKLFSDAKELILENVAAAVSALPPAEKGEPGDPGPHGEPGLVDMEIVKNIISEEVVVAVSTLSPAEKGEPGEAGEPGPQGEPGLVDLEIVKSIIAEEVVVAVSMLPPAEKGDTGEPGPQGESGQDGRDIEDFSITQVGRELEVAVVLGDTRMVYELELPEGLPGKDGVSVDMDAVGSIIRSSVDDAFSAIPIPKDGENGKDGISVVDALIDRSGGLVHIMADGTVKSLGLVTGQDGKDGIGFSEAFEDDGKFIVRMTDGSELTMPLPAALELPDMEPPEETCELVAKALRAFAELPEPAIEIQPAPEPAKQSPIVLNVNAGGVSQAPPKMIKTITTRRDGAGNLTADIVERPDIE